jgi:hypothetical protein
MQIFYFFCIGYYRKLLLNFFFSLFLKYKLLCSFVQFSSHRQPVALGRLIDSLPVQQSYYLDTTKKIGADSARTALREHFLHEGNSCSLSALSDEHEHNYIPVSTITTKNISHPFHPTHEIVKPRQQNWKQQFAAE